MARSCVSHGLVCAWHRTARADPPRRLKGTARDAHVRGGGGVARQCVQTRLVFGPLVSRAHGRVSMPSGWWDKDKVGRNRETGRNVFVTPKRSAFYLFPTRSAANADRPARVGAKRARCRRLGHSHLGLMNASYAHSFLQHRNSKSTPDSRLPRLVYPTSSPLQPAI